MDIVLVYFMGCLLAFGIIYTFVIPAKSDGMPNSHTYFYGVISSWLTVVLFLFGILIGVMKGARGDED